MKLQRILSLTLLMGLLGHGASAQTASTKPVGFFQFAFPAGTDLAGQTETNGRTWTAAGPAGPQITIAVNSLAVPGLAPPAGNRARLAAGTGPAARIGLGTNVTDGTLYYSLVLRVANLGTLGPSGGTLAAFNNATGASANLPAPLAARLLVRSTAGGCQIGLSKSSTNGNDFVWAPTTLDTNETAFVVLAYEFKAGADDLASLWLNPSAASLDGAWAPPATVNSTNGAGIPGAQSFVLMQRPQPALPAVAFVDEIRVGTSWSSVTPPEMEFTDPPDLAVALDVRPATVISTSNLYYSVTVTNGGAGVATGALLTLPLPTGVAFASAAASQGSCSNSQSGVQCALGALQPGATATVNVVGIPDFDQLAAALNLPDMQETISISNRVSVAATEAAARSLNNTATAIALVLPLRDFGDAPYSATYHTLYADDGARHRLSGPYFGGSPPGHAQRDRDDDGMPSPNADGDNAGDGNNDEAGVRFLDALIPGSSTVRVELNAPIGGRVDGWIDFNGDHDWADAGERIFSSLLVPAGVSTHTISVPANALPGETYARLRISENGGLSFQSYANNGEVEDDQVTISVPVVVVFAGVPHLALGNATVSSNATGLLVANLGASGQDGVSIALQERSRSIRVQFAEDHDEGGGVAQAFAAYGMVNDVPDLLLGKLTLRNNNGVTELVFDATPVATTLQVEVYNHTTLAGSVMVPANGVLGTVSGPGRLVAVTAGAAEPSASRWTVFDLEFSPELVSFSPAGLTGDRVRLVALNPTGSLQNLLRLDVTGQNVGSLLIEQETAPIFQPRLRMETAGERVKLKWDSRAAVLQRAPTVNGPWSYVLQATNTVELAATRARNEFYRLQNHAETLGMADPIAGTPGAFGVAVGVRNILLIIADDLGVDQCPPYIDYYNKTANPIAVDTSKDVIKTDTLKNLAAAGVMFVNAWSCPVCSPTRACLFTGNYSFRDANGIYNALGPEEEGIRTGPKTATKTIAEVLSASIYIVPSWPFVGSYANGLFGKWHLGEKHEDDNPVKLGWQRHYGALGADLGSYYPEYWNSTATHLKVENNSDTGVGGTVPATYYATKENVDDAMGWINAQTGNWMATVAFNAPHFAGSLGNYELADSTYCTSRSGTDNLTKYRSIIECMDEQIGALLAGIRNKLTNTTIIFMGDNGTEIDLTEHFKAANYSGDNHAKGTLYEGGVNVPLIIADGYAYLNGQESPSTLKGRVVSPGRDVKKVVQTMDLFATIAEVAGGNASSGQDSISLVPYLESASASSKRSAIFAETRPKSWQAGDTWVCGDKGWDVAVQNFNHHKLIIRDYDPSTRLSKSNRYEIYDLNSDRWEQEDLVKKNGWTGTNLGIFYALRIQIEYSIGALDVCPVK